MNVALRRFAFYVVSAWASITLNFAIPRLMPGDPAAALVARFKGQLAPEALRALRHTFGLVPGSMLTQYFTYLAHVARGDLGLSIAYFPAPVTEVIGTGLGWSVGLGTLALAISFTLGTLLGVVAAWRRHGRLDSWLPPALSFLGAFPYFWLAMLAIWLFAIKIHWLPQSGGYDFTNNVGWTWTFVWDAFKHSILPALTILVTSIGGWILTMRNNTITVLTEDYVRMARAKGLSPWRVMWTYAGRNAILPNLTGFAMSLGLVVSGAILVEFVFNYPGVGWMFLQSVENQDYALMQGLFLMIVVAVLTAILAADAATAVLDPRTRDVR